MKGKINLKAFLALTVLMVSGLTAEHTWGKYGGGSGTANDPYLIYTHEQMNAVGLHPEDWDKHFKLMENIDLACYTGTEFNIIETFTGVFDGDNHEIKNFNYQTGYITGVGIFGRLSGNGEITNLGLRDINISIRNGWSGSIVGEITSGTVSRCYAIGGLFTSSRPCSHIGGLIGVNKGSVRDCYADVKVVGSNREDNVLYGSCGCLIGYNYGIVSNSYAIADIKVTGDYNTFGTGGLVGTNSGGYISNCYTSGTVAGVTRVGGLVGDNASGTISECFSIATVVQEQDLGTDHGVLVGANNGTIRSSYASGNVVGSSSNIGGLVGRNGYYAFGAIPCGRIEESYATSNVKGYQCVGGLVGLNSGLSSDYKGAISKSYSMGNVEGSHSVGGLVGESDSAIISDSYSKNSVIGSSRVGGVVGTITAAVGTT